MKLIIQIPCYNEAETLEIALNDLPKHIDGVDEIEYLIINDGSKDNTVEVAKRWGVNYVVNFKQNKGLAKGFMAGLDACLRNGADIIVNTDADNQYVGKDIAKLIQPILDGKADMVVGERPIDETEHFSPLKKKLQHFGSWVVRKASRTDIPDAPSGFRAYSREAAMRMNVVNEYTYTLETIVQAGRNKMAITSVPIRTNGELRPSRLFNSMMGYVKKSMLTIIRAFLMYRPLMFFTTLGSIMGLIGAGIGIRFLCYWFAGTGAGHIQSLILASMMIILGVMTIIVGLQGDIIAANRKLLEDIQYHVRKLDYDSECRSASEEDGKEHLTDRKCNTLCQLFENGKRVQNGVIVHSELLLDYLKTNYPGFYFVSSTTKVLTGFEEFLGEIRRDEFRYVVPDFRLNKTFAQLEKLSEVQKNKVEFLCNECCWYECWDRKHCYENVSRKNLGETCPDHHCVSPGAKKGYLFSKAMVNPGFIGIQDIKNTYLPMGFSNFKIEGRGLGSALILEFLLYYMTKPEYQLQVREKIYLDSMLDLF